jgi:branched-chain amino acid transport system permease protein
MMTSMLQILFSGLTTGAIYALVASGFTLIYRASGVFNFAQGEFLVMGGMLTAAGLAAGASWPLSILIALLVTTAVGLAMFIFGVRLAMGAEPVQLLIITIGASVLIRGVLSVTLGKDFVRLPNFVSPEVVRVYGAVVQTQALIVIAGVAVILLMLRALLSGTLVGKAVTATSANSFAAQLVGINPNLMIGFCFAVSALIGAVCGVIATPITMTSYDAGTLLAVKGFAAAILGGVGHPAGPLLGGLLIGLLEAFGAGYLSSMYKDALAFLVMLIVLSVRPQGLLSIGSVERV